MAESALSIRSLNWPDSKVAIKTSFSLGRENYLVFICFSLAQLIATQLLMLIPMVGFLALVFIQAFFTVSFVGSVEALVRKDRTPQLKDLGFPYLHVGVVQKILPVMGVLFAIVLSPILVCGLGIFYYFMANPALLNENFIYVSAGLGLVYASVFNLAGYIFYFGVIFVLQHQLSTGRAVKSSFAIFLKNFSAFLLLDAITIFPAAVGMGIVTIAAAPSTLVGGAFAKAAMGGLGLLISPFFMCLCYLIYRKSVAPPSPEPTPIIS